MDTPWRMISGAAGLIDMLANEVGIVYRSFVQVNGDGGVSLGRTIAEEEKKLEE